MNTIRIGLFFDGTGNNGFNATALIARHGGSYQASPTNVYKLFKSYEIASSKIEQEDEVKRIAIYVEGIGTVNYHNDSEVDFATGSAFVHYGGRSKIRNALEYINNAVLKHFQQYPDYTDVNFEFDIFGFSRGAILARTFAERLTDKANDKTFSIYETLKKIVQDNGAKLISVKTNFVGLFDSVASFKRNDMGLTNKIIAKHVYHLTAMHECRKNFPLTSLISEKIVKKAPNEQVEGCYFEERDNTSIYEFCVPGCHADIGGGYLHHDNVKSMITLPRIKNKTKQDGEFFKNSPKWSYVLTSDYLKVRTKNFQYYLSYEREKLSAELHLVYLMLMLETAIRFNCKFDLDYIKSNYYNRLPKGLHDFYEVLKEKNSKFLLNKTCESFTLEELKLVGPYIHISANYNSFFDSKLKPNPDDPIKPSPIKSIQFKIEDNKIRKIFDLNKLRIDRVNEPNMFWNREINYI